MNLLQKIQSRFHALFGKRKLDAEMDEEMRSHVELRTQANIAAGMNPEEAWFAALREFGWSDSIKENCREQRGVNWIESFFKDLNFAFRMLCKNPGFTTVAVLTLSLGIGATTTILSIINSIMLKPVMSHHPEQLVGVYQHDSEKPYDFHYFSYPDFADLRSNRNSAFTDLFAYTHQSVAIQGDFLQVVRVALVSANYFTALGVVPALGRGFLPDEETSGAPVAVLSHTFWKKLGANPAIVGTKLKLVRGDVTVVGVMPDGFTGAQFLPVAIYLPLGTPDSLISGPGQAVSRSLSDRSDRRFSLMGRLKPGINLGNASGALSVMSSQFAIADPAEARTRTLVCASPSRFNSIDQPDQKRNGLVPIAGFAFGLSVLVLVIACLNLANLMLARGSARRKEIAVRLALGARRHRILRQLLTEGMFLALLGSGAGLLVSVGATKIIATLIYSGGGMPPDFPIFDFSTDWRVLVTLMVLSGFATLLFALGPSWKLARLDFNSDLKQQAGEDNRRSRFFPFSIRDLLAVGQMAFTLALLVAAALFSRSAIKVYQANPGFEFGSNFYVALDPGLTGYTDAQDWKLNRDASETISTLPGVASVSSALYVPFGNANGICTVQFGGAPPANDQATTLAEGKELYPIYNVVGADYFHTLGIPLLRGREFDQHEETATNAQPVAIISQNLADQLWPGQEAVGRTIQFPANRPDQSPKRLTVVGVVPAIQWRLFKDELPLAVYVPLGQDFHRDFKLHVRVASGVDSAGLMATVREKLHRLDPGVPLTEVKTLAAMHRDGPYVRVSRLGAILFGAFGALALLLSSLGIYGLKAYAVARRTREIGIRMALGATTGDVVKMILRESTWLTGIGLGVGLLLALVLGRVTARFLYQVPPLDLPTFILIPPLLLSIALLACWFPARRAAKVNPMLALRQE